jgi:hypothetical protein
MRSKLLIIILLSIAMTATAKIPDKHRDYVRKEITAIKIAEAVLTSKYGQEKVKAQLPLHAKLIDKKLWLIEGRTKDEKTRGNYRVVIEKYSGCIQLIENVE